MGLGLDEDGGPTWELGRPETGATALIVEEGNGVFRLHVPLLRSPTSARDLLPPLVAAADAIACDWRGPVDGDPLAVWDLLHRDACAEWTGPHLPRVELERLHAWLLALGGSPASDHRPMLLVLDPPTRVVVGAPDLFPARLPPFPILKNGADGLTRVFPSDLFGAPGEDGFLHVDKAPALDDADGEIIPADTRVLTPVEIVDDEAITG